VWSIAGDTSEMPDISELHTVARCHPLCSAT
jgi:hypothetical protein